MRWTHAVLALALSVLAGGHALPSGQPIETENLKIVGGDVTDISKFPYQVALLFYEDVICGGSILNENFILTAAHCVNDITSPDDYAIRAGSTFYERGGQLVPVAKAYWNHRFTEQKLNYDVGLLQLAKPLTFNDVVRPVELVDVGADPKWGSSITLSGWGVIHEGYFAAAPVLRTTKVKAVNRWLCSLPYFFKTKITDAMFCAAALGKDSCSGDSGSPAVNADGKQVGIVSFGVGCARVFYPGVYTNLANKEVRAFINETISSVA